MMRILFFALTIGMLLASTEGCGRKSEPGGQTDRSATEFVLHGPSQSISLKPGETQTVNMKIDRGKEFHQTVKLDVDSPKGISVELNPKQVGPNDGSEVNVRVTARPDAPAGQQSIHITGNPEKGKATSLNLTVNVKDTEKRSERFSLSAPSTATTIKQGDTKTITLTMKPGSDFREAMTLKAEAPEGITVEVTPNKLDATGSNADVNLRVNVGKSVASGNHTIRVTATPASGTAHTTEVRIHVTEP